MVTYKSSTEGVARIAAKRRHSGMTIEDLAEKTVIGTSTVKRFLKGKPVRPENFRILCETLDFQEEEWKALIDWQDNDSARVDIAALENWPLAPSPAAQEKSSQGGTIAITGTFAEDKRQEIEICLEHLKALMKSGTITVKFAASNQCFTEDLE